MSTALSTLLAAALSAQALPSSSQSGSPPDVHVTPGAVSGVPGSVTPRPVPKKPAPEGKPGVLMPGRQGGLPEITANVNLVLVPVTVTDPLSRMVTGLQKNFFSVSEDGVPQTITSFSSEDAPVSVGVVFDTSGSMSDKIDKSRKALIDFFETANPDDEFFLVDFSGEPRLLCSFTSDINKIEDAVQLLQPHGRTALLDAVYLALEEMRNARYNRRALLIISDGGDNHSRYSERDVEQVVREADVQIFGIGLYESPYDRTTPEEINGPELMDKLTDSTGGKTFEIHNLDDLADTATKIGIELRNEYVLGYTSTDKARNGKWRKIQVKLHPPPGLPPLTVSARKGYYGPHL